MVYRSTNWPHDWTLRLYPSRLKESNQDQSRLKQLGRGAQWNCGTHRFSMIHDHVIYIYNFCLMTRTPWPPHRGFTSQLHYYTDPLTLLSRKASVSWASTESVRPGESPPGVRHRSGHSIPAPFGTPRHMRRCFRPGPLKNALGLMGVACSWRLTRVTVLAW
jgi:hypothetical protein